MASGRIMITYLEKPKRTRIPARNVRRAPNIREPMDNC
jgi:hypothetical protein